MSLTYEQSAAVLSLANCLNEANSTLQQAANFVTQVKRAAEIDEQDEAKKSADFVKAAEYANLVVDLLDKNYRREDGQPLLKTAAHTQTLVEKFASHRSTCEVAYMLAQELCRCRRESQQVKAASLGVPTEQKEQKLSAEAEFINKYAR